MKTQLILIFFLFLCSCTINKFYIIEQPKQSIEIDTALHLYKKYNQSPIYPFYRIDNDTIWDKDKIICVPL